MARRSYRDDPQARESSDGPSGEVASFAKSLGEKEHIVLAVRDELYDGSWARMQQDLEARMAGNAYVFRLNSRIEEDLDITRKLSEFERHHGINLSDYLEEGR